jgi:hypothetical protein
MIADLSSNLTRTVATSTLCARALLAAIGERRERGHELATFADGGYIVDAERRAVTMTWDALGSAPVASETRGIDSVTATTGQPFSFTSAGAFAPLMRAQMGAVGRARFINLPSSGLFSFPRQNGPDLVGQWRPENPASPLTTTDLVDAAVNAQARTLVFGLRFSRQMLFSAADNYDIGKQLTNLIIGAAGAEFGRVAINGGGPGSDQPLGLLNDSNVATMAIGANGGPLTGAQCGLMEEAVALANSDVGALAFHTTPQVRRYTRGVERFTGSGPLWTDANTLIGYPAYVSTNTPSNLTKGASSGICSALIYANWLDLLMITFGPGIDIVIDPFSKKFQGMVELYVALYADVAIRRTASFRKTVDITT